MFRYYLKNPEHKLARATEGASGFDLIYDGEATILLEPGQRGTIPTGLYLELPLGLEGQVRPRSGLAVTHGVTVLNAPGTIDSDYRGEVQVILINHGRSRLSLNRGNRIAQLVIAPVFLPGVAFTPHSSSAPHPVRMKSYGELSTTARGVQGLGSTGT